MIHYCSLMYGYISDTLLSGGRQDKIWLLIVKVLLAIFLSCDDKFCTSTRKNVSFLLPFRYRLIFLTLNKDYFECKDENCLCAFSQVNYLVRSSHNITGKLLKSGYRPEFLKLIVWTPMTYPHNFLPYVYPIPQKIYSSRCMHQKKNRWTEWDHTAGRFMCCFKNTRKIFMSLIILNEILNSSWPIISTHRHLNLTITIFPTE